MSDYIGVLDDVVVVGYGTQRRRNISGSVSVVNVADAKKTATYDVAKMLQGHAAGVTVQGFRGIRWLPKDVPGINASNALMMVQVRSIQWTEDGWPVVMPERYAVVPKSTITEQSLVGNWEQITLQYQYQVIQRSASVVLTADKKVSGSVSVVWSFDDTKSLLTINGNKYIVTDAWDWEVSTRKVTLTYAGLTPAGVSIWAKKLR